MSKYIIILMSSIIFERSARDSVMIGFQLGILLCYIAIFPRSLSFTELASLSR